MDLFTDWTPDGRSLTRGLSSEQGPLAPVDSTETAHDRVAGNKGTPAQVLTAQSADKLGMHSAGGAA